MSLAEGATIAGIVVATMTAARFLMIGFTKVFGTLPGRVLVTQDYCASQHRQIADHIENIKCDLKELKGDVKDLNRRVQNGDIANRLADRVAEQVKQHLKIK